MLPNLQLAAALTSTIAPFTPYLVEAGKKFAGEAGKSAWKTAESIWKKLVSSEDSKEVKAAAKAVATNVSDPAFGDLLTSAIERLLNARPELATDLITVLGGPTAVQEILAQDNAIIRDVKQRMDQAGSQTMRATGSAKIIGANQTIGSSKPKHR